MNENKLHEHIARIQQDGFTVLPPQLTAAQCDEAQLHLDRLAEARDRGGFELIFNKARIFEQLYQALPALALIRGVLGADALLSGMHGSIVRPGEGGGGLHADGILTGHTRPTSMSLADGGKRITSHIMSLNTIWCISDFTLTNGATRLAPGSHHFERLDMPEGALETAKPVAAERGSVVVFNVNTWHGPSKNESSANRYAVLNPWRRHWQRCEFEMGRAARPEVLERAGEQRIIFGEDAVSPTMERYLWDTTGGKPKNKPAGESGR
jgi:ectoine hydroxylase-related dioxygenase (phytanoyl-CoA dioxygenase family)